MISPWVLVAAALLQSDAAPHFETASIKPNKSGERNTTWHYSPGRWSGENVPVKLVIMTAYKLKESQLVGAPGWTETERYDIDAKAEGNASEDQQIAMLQALLKERFMLKYHRAEKKMTVFAVVPAKGGLKMPEGKPGSCTDSNSKCGAYFYRRNQFDGTGITMHQFADALSNFMDRPVVDKTARNGIFNIHMTWNAEGNELDTDGDDTGPSIFTAIEEQLGLRLQATSAPVSMLVIDHIERPSEN